MPYTQPIASWPGGPMRRYYVREGQPIPVAAPTEYEAVSSPYYCPKCSQTAAGVYLTSQGWICGTCKEGR